MQLDGKTSVDCQSHHPGRQLHAGTTGNLLQLIIFKIFKVKFII